VTLDGRHPSSLPPRSEIMQFFEYEHLAPDLAMTASLFARLANNIDMGLPDSAEKSVCLRKLLEAKDAAVRATLTAEHKDIYYPDK